MNVARTLQLRRRGWDELQRMCDTMQWRGRPKTTVDPSSVKAGGDDAAVSADGVVEDAALKFASLYRSACADLALASAYQMSPATEAYLQRLVARAHNQLYRSERLAVRSWPRVLVRDAPQKIFSDPCVRLAAIIFFGLFTLAMWMGRNEALFPDFAENVVGAESLRQTQDSFSHPLNGSLEHYVQMAAFYIKHNTGIGLVCFGLGILILPCLIQLAYNAVTLGTTFGYMARPQMAGSENFYHFVTAHGPFELTAIVLAAAAGLKLGVGLFRTDGLRRVDSVRLAAKDALPIMAASATLFVLAAFTEGFISPSPLPYLAKCLWSILSSGLISFYIVVLGFPRGEFSELLDSRGIVSSSLGHQSAREDAT